MSSDIAPIRPEILEACKATDPAALERRIMDPNLPKNKAEHWARSELTRLQSENTALKALVSELVNAAEPFDLEGACAPTWPDEMYAPVEILEGIKVGDLRSLSTALLAAREALK